MSDDQPTLLARVEAIEARNLRVEEDKTWETSLTRRLSIMAITYVFAVLTMILIGASQPYLGALVPVLGFLLSTLSLPLMRKFWVRFLIKRKR